MKVVIGDIHGCFDELVELLSKIGPGRDDEIISLGDMIDRGPASDKVVKFFIETPSAQVLMGNHERKHVRHLFYLLQDRNFGKAQQLTVEQFKRAGMDYEKAVNCFANLPLYIDLPEAILVHAGLVYGISLEKQNEKVLTGAGFLPENQIDEKSGLQNWCLGYPVDAKPVIFGHLSLHVEQPHQNLWHLDTGCCRGGSLTAVTLPDWKLWQVKSRKDYYKELRKTV